MCVDCWKELGSPTIVNDKTIIAARLIAYVYEHCGVGGGAHIVLDDWNLEDSSIDFCLGYIYSDSHKDVSAGQIVAEEGCLRTLREMTVEERASALALYKGLIAFAL